MDLGSRVLSSLACVPKQRRIWLASLALVLSFGAAAAAPATPAGPTGALKKTVSVDLFQATESVGGTVTAEGMTAMLVDALVKDGRFVVVERPALASVQAEQALGAAGSTTAETKANPNALIGSSVIIRGAVIKYEAQANGGSLQAGSLPLAGMFGATAGVKAQQAVMEISLRLIDTTTGQVVTTANARGTASATDLQAGAVNPNTGANFTADAFHNTPIGEAGQEAIKDAVEKIASGMSQVPWSALVVDVDTTKVYLNAGADRNVQAGLVLNVYRKGKVFTDPGTGEVLDVDMETVGQIRVDSVRAKLSTASIVSGNPPMRGDILKLQ